MAQPILDLDSTIESYQPMREFMAVLSLALIAPLASAGCQTSWVDSSPERMERFFRDLVFGEDFSRSIAYTRLRKWTVHWKVSITGDVRPDDRREIEAALGEVASLTRMRWQVVDASTVPPNLSFVFTVEHGIRFMGEHVPCFTTVAAPQGGITSAEIVIATADRRAARPCITHELMHAVGFPKHSGVLPSVSSPFYRDVRWTEWDRIALRILYDRRLRAGMTETQAAPVYRAIIGELM